MPRSRPTRLFDDNARNNAEPTPNYHGDGGPGAAPHAGTRCGRGICADIYACRSAHAGSRTGGARRPERDARLGRTRSNSHRRAGDIHSDAARGSVRARERTVRTRKRSVWPR